MKKIAFITDGGKNIGMGHIVQSTTLAIEIKAAYKHFDIIFLTKSAKQIIKYIQEHGFNVFRKKTDDELFDTLKDIAPKLIIIDKIDVNEAFAKRIKENLSSKLAIFTNITSANRYADIAVIAVIADFGSNFRNIKYFNEKTNTLYCLGPKYWILRREFYELMKKKKKIPDKIQKILLLFGGSDPLNITTAALERLLTFEEDFFIDVVLGNGFRFYTSLKQVLYNCPVNNKKVEIFRNIKNVAEMMFKADLILTSPGLSLFEALSIGTPAIVFHQNALQADEYKGFISTLEKTEIHNLQSIIKNRKFVDPNSDFISKLEIGQGKEELLKILLENIER